MAPLKWLVMTSEADEGVSSDVNVSEMLWLHQVILKLGRCRRSRSNGFHVVYLSLCAVCAYVYVCKVMSEGFAGRG